MVDDPYTVLGLPPDANDEAIRQRYLECVRECPPERDGARFARVREAYEALKDLSTRMNRRFFEPGKSDSLDALIEELACRSPRQRVTLETLLKAARSLD